jgi:hypothetical protein
LGERKDEASYHGRLFFLSQKEKTELASAAEQVQSRKAGIASLFQCTNPSWPLAGFWRFAAEAASRPERKAKPSRREAPSAAKQPFVSASLAILIRIRLSLFLYIYLLIFTF